MFALQSCELISRYSGAPDRTLKTLFEQARGQIPSIIFIDEIDIFTGNDRESEHESTRRIMTEFLVQMIGIKESYPVTVIAATNCPWTLAPAVRRCFAKKVHIPLPESNERAQLIKKNLMSTTHLLSEKDLAEIVEKTRGYTIADLICLVRDAIMSPLRKIQKSTKFKIDSRGYYSLVNENDPDAVSMTWEAITDPSKLIVSPITIV